MKNIGAATLTLLFLAGAALADSNAAAPLPWGPEQACGAPDTRQAGDRKTAWASATADGQDEWLELTFPEPVRPIAVLVYENLNPGALIQVSAQGEGGRSAVLWSGKDPTDRSAEKGVSLVPVSPAFDLNRIRLHLASKSVPGWNEIDAVGLLDADGRTHWAATAIASSTYGERTTSKWVVTKRTLEQRVAKLEAEVAALKAELARLRGGTASRPERVLEKAYGRAGISPVQVKVTPNVEGPWEVEIRGIDPEKARSFLGEVESSPDRPRIVELLLRRTGDAWAGRFRITRKGEGLRSALGTWAALRQAVEARKAEIGYLRLDEVKAGPKSLSFAGLIGNRGDVDLLEEVIRKIEGVEEVTRDRTLEDPETEKFRFGLTATLR